MVLTNSKRLRVGLVAGEASGDTLGAALIEALRARVDELVCAGVAGPKMQAAGCTVWEPAESLAVMGLFEVVRELPRLKRLKDQIRDRFLKDPPDVFIGIDSPEFNLRLARDLRAAGIPTVQYVSPQVWAWRQRRVADMHRAVDLVLCLLPFEQRFYLDHGVRAQFVGHPLADAIPLAVDREAARRALGLPANAPIVALLPGSRRGEVSRLAGDFAATVKALAKQRPDVRFIAPLASAATRALFAATLARQVPQIPVTLIDGQAQSALIASNAALVASGTASLEAALCKRPMVVVYRLGALTAALIKHLKLVKSPFFAQPNLLAERRVVGEYFQDQIVPEAIAAELARWLTDGAARAALEEEFTRMHTVLRRDASGRAAEAVLELHAASQHPGESASPASTASPGSAQ
ncbi:MAG TPA: lipid-A-disaccharide synthase [Steroidobacteraceae bacterium]|nr:lipid-A-disaccharide synthase [Steroidobacteraceae bacterium]